MKPLHTYNSYMYIHTYSLYTYIPDGGAQNAKVQNTMPSEQPLQKD